MNNLGLVVEIQILSLNKKQAETLMKARVHAYNLDWRAKFITHLLSLDTSSQVTTLLEYQLNRCSVSSLKDEWKASSWFVNTGSFSDQMEWLAQDPLPSLKVLKGQLLPDTLGKTQPCFAECVWVSEVQSGNSGKLVALFTILFFKQTFNSCIVPV